MKWRLPTIQELTTLVNYEKYDPACDLEDTISEYWSSTTSANLTNYAWIVCFDNGYQYNSTKTNNYYVRCVRALRDGSLEWTESSTDKMTWDEAMQYAEEMNVPPFKERCPEIEQKLCQKYMEVESKMKTNIKMKVTQEQSIKVQEICFANGYSWGNKGITTTSYTNYPLLVLRGSRSLTFADIDDITVGITDVIDADLFIRTNGTCEENLCKAEDFPIYSTKVEPNKRTFATKGDLIEALMRGEKWTLKDYLFYCFYDESEEDPFRYGEEQIGYIWNCCDNKTIWTRVIEKKTITLPDNTVLPEPAREPLKNGQEYWLINFIYKRKTEAMSWDGYEEDYELLKEGKVHLAEADAKAWADYFLSLMKEK